MRPTVDRASLIAVLFVLCAAICPSCGNPPTEKSEKPSETSAEEGMESRHELDVMIDALANRVNTPPTMERNHAPSYVLFREDYDHAEQSRVFRALYELNKRDGNELWQRLVAHLDDKRYALTWYQGNGMTYNMTVGKLCALIARSNLRLAYERLSPTDESLPPHVVHLVFGPDFTDGKFAAWCEKRKGKQLFEMQVDLLEWTITEPKALEDLSAAQRDEYVGKVKAEIERLKQTREPVVDKERFDTTFYSIYSEMRIKGFREQAEKTHARPAVDEGAKKARTDSNQKGHGRGFGNYAERGREAEENKRNKGDSAEKSDEP